MKFLGVLFVALHLALLAAPPPASACSGVATCAERFCLGEQTLLEATLLSRSDGTADYDEGTFQVLAVHGTNLGLVAGENVTLRVETYLYDSDVGERLLVGLVGTPSNVRASWPVMRMDPGGEFAACVGQPGELDGAAAAAMLLATDCEAQLDALDGNGELAARANGTSTPCSCAVGDAETGSLVIVAVALVLARRRRRPISGARP